MTFATPILRTQQSADALWYWVDAMHWRAIAHELNESGFVRCEWLKTVHQGEQTFDVYAKFSTHDASTSCIIVTQTTNELPSIGDLYVSAQFHERESTQMLGIAFIGSVASEPAFQATFSGHPLRRDFALQPRVDTTWPGQVDPDKAARRRPTMPPGVHQEWSS